MLIVIEGPTFVCGLGVEDGVVRVVPPMFGWAKGKRLAVIVDYCKRKGFKLEKHPDGDQSQPRRDAGALP
jgi:hypothetical protein